VPLRGITDGLSKTLLFSEQIVVGTTIGWQGPLSDVSMAMGGQHFTGFRTPNHLGCDETAGGTYPIESARNGRPGNGGVPNGPCTLVLSHDSVGVEAQVFAARSKHPGGVVAAACDGARAAARGRRRRARGWARSGLSHIRDAQAPLQPFRR
jgi:hypothetical protein